MNRILLLLLFSLFLLPNMKVGSYSSVSAQNMAYENGSWWLPEVEVHGKEKIQCCYCFKYYDASYWYCPDCEMECEFCSIAVQKEIMLFTLRLIVCK